VLRKIINILKYYDSEPSEIAQGFIWLILFPIIYYFEVGLNTCLIIPSILIGFVTLRSVCYHSLKIRKTMAYTCFLFSIIAVVFWVLSGDIARCPTHWFWIAVSIGALFNLSRISDHYHCNSNKCEDGR